MENSHEHDFNKDYFPFTDVCLIDGKKCIKNEACKLWYDNQKCWYVDFNSYLCAFFDSEDPHFIPIKDQGRYSEGLRHLHFYLDYSDKFDNASLNVEVRIGLNSHRLAEKVREHFSLLDWVVESRNFEGGDDADLVIKYPLLFKGTKAIEDKLLMLKDLTIKIIEYEKIINKCLICGNKAWSLTEYDGKGICPSCEQRIIKENISKYIKCENSND